MALSVSRTRIFEVSGGLSTNLGRRRFDHKHAANLGVGNPDFADIGAYEGPYRVNVVVMCWIDESYMNGGYERYYFDPCLYFAHLAGYRDVINKILVVKSGCLVPPYPEFNDPEKSPYLPGIKPVLPPGQSPPPEIRVETCNRPPESRAEFIDDFDNIRANVEPDYLCLSVDNSGSMKTIDIETHYSLAPDDNFKDWIQQNYPDITRARDGQFDFTNQAWVDEMRIQVQSIIDDL